MVLLDLGLSSLQIDEKDRGFAYSSDAPLDMRMDGRQELTAADLVARLDTRALARIFSRYGQERQCPPHRRCHRRGAGKAPITTTAALSGLVDRVVPRKGRPAGNPAKRVFQAPHRRQRRARPTGARVPRSSAVSWWASADHRRVLPLA